MIKFPPLVLLAFLTGAAATDLAIDISIPPSPVSTANLQRCICNAIVSEVNGIDSCQFENSRRMEEEQAEEVDEAERELGSNPCASCSPGPSGAVCRWMYCRRRLEGGIELNSIALISVEMDIEACLGSAVNGQVGAELVITP
jgi:hypothetical protein